MDLSYSVCGVHTDYVGFIKRVMKQVQRPAYTSIKHFEVDLTPLEEAEVAAPPRKWPWPQLTKSDVVWVP